MPETSYYILLLKKFNNYFNRIIKTFDDTEVYEDASEDSFLYPKPVNYDPKDNVSTEAIINNCPFEPDYAIYIDEDRNIISRWFVMESVVTRNKQRLFKLRRDVISDFKDKLMESPMFVQKGFLNEGDSFIVNDEGMSFNQVKKAEILLKDKTNSAWIVGYMAKNAPSATITEQIQDEAFTNYETIEDIAAELGITSSVLDGILTTNNNNPTHFVNDNIEIVVWINLSDLRPTEYKTIAGSQNFLQSFTYHRNTTIESHNPTSDCIAVIRTDAGQGSLDQALMTLAMTNHAGTVIQNVFQSHVAEIRQNFSTYTQGRPLLTKPMFDRLQNLVKNNTIIYKNGKYYNVKIANLSGPTNTGYNFPITAGAGLGLTIKNEIISGFNAATGGDPYLEALATGQYFLNYNDLVANFYLEEVSVSSLIPAITITMSSTRNAIQNQPYDIFAIPFNNTRLIKNGEEHEIVGSYAQKIAMKLVESLTSSNIYDVQLLPYCPIPEIAGNDAIDISSLTENYDYDLIYKTNNAETFVSDTVTPDYDPLFSEYDASWENLQKPEGTGTLTNADINVIYSNDNHASQSIIISNQTASSVNIIVSFQVIDPTAPAPKVTVSWNYTATNPALKSLIIYPKTNSFSVNLSYNLTLVKNMKIDSQAIKHRLVSPNYQGSFEFNVAKNGGAVNGFIAECTYKPYVPYVKVVPNFSFLYGTNFGDCRGLICSGDFSIGIINSAWENYQLQNKNYQNIFNREIQNLDFEHSIQMRKEVITGALGVGAAGITGGIMGAQAGGIYGAIAGAAIGTFGSAAGMTYDIDMLSRQQHEQKSLAVDKFNYQLGNIKALPYTLTKVGAFDINSKIWPFVETYSATDEEIAALEKKIVYESMTVMRIDTIGNYMDAFAEKHYLKGELIRNEEIAEDNHIFEAIYTEFVKGVYC